MALVGNSIILIDNEPGNAGMLYEAAVKSILFAPLKSVFDDFCRVHVATSREELMGFIEMSRGRNVLLIVDLFLSDKPSPWGDATGQQVLGEAIRELVCFAEDYELRGLLYSKSHLVHNLRTPPASIHEYANMRRETLSFWRRTEGVLTARWMSSAPEFWTIGWLLGQFYLPASKMQMLISGLLNIAGYSALINDVLEQATTGVNSYLAPRIPKDHANHFERINILVPYLAQYSSILMVWPQFRKTNEVEWMEGYMEENSNAQPPIRAWMDMIQPIVINSAFQATVEEVLRCFE